MEVNGGENLTGERDPRPLAEAIRGRLGPPPTLGRRPPVSIVVVNRDRADHLRRLVSGLIHQTDYSELELILIDNDSSDDSLDYMRAVDAPFPISLHSNPHNETFSDACNQGAGMAAGDLILFLNNDVEPFEPGWLDELVACYLDRAPGVLGATLLYPDEASGRFELDYGVQHRGMRFLEEEGLLRADLLDYRADPFDGRFGLDIDSPAVTAACLLVERTVFERVGGFSRGYRYGAEDTDLCLKIGAEGLAVISSGRTFLIHHPGSTRRTVPHQEQIEAQIRNRRLLWERWGPTLRREYERDRLSGAGRWAFPESLDSSAPPAREEVESPSLCIKLGHSAEGHVDPHLAELAEGLRERLLSRNRRVLALIGDTEDPRGLNFDAAIHIRGPARHLPKPCQFNVLLVTAEPESVPELERRRFDLAIDATRPSLDPAELESLVCRLLEVVDRR